MSPRQNVQLLAFTVGHQAFVLDVMRVVELVRSTPVHPLPEQPEWLEGNMLVRGQLLPVVDVAWLLQPERRHAPLSTRSQGPVIVVRVATHTLGLRVDQLLEVIRPSMGALVPTAQSGPFRSKFAMGQVSLRGHTYTLFDVRPLLAL